MLKIIVIQISEDKKYKQNHLRVDWNYFTLYSKSTVQRRGKLSTLSKKQPSKGKKQVQNYIQFVYVCISILKMKQRVHNHNYSKCSDCGSLFQNVYKQ